MLHRSTPRPNIPDVVADAAGRCIANWRVLGTVTLVGAVLIGAINYGLLQALPQLDQAQESPEQTRQLVIDGAPYLTALLLVQVFTETAVVVAALQILRGKQPDARASLVTGLRRLPATLVATLLFLLVVVACVGTIILIPLGLYFAVSWAVMIQVIVDDGAGPLRALAQSRRLVRGNWWRTFGIGASLLLLAFLVNLLMAQVGGNDLLVSAGAAVGSLLIIPFLAMGLTIVYEDLRAAQPAPPRPTQPPPWERTDV